MNYKFLPIGGTDLWSHYPAASPFTNDLLMQPAAEVQAPASQEHPVTEDGQDYMIGSPRAAGHPADDWMVGSPRAAGAPNGEIPAAERPDADPPTDEGRAVYEAAVAALDQHTYASPFADTTMAAPVH